jgi:hypothetical protein
MKQIFILIQVLICSFDVLAQGGGVQGNVTSIPVTGFFPHFSIQAVPRDTSSRLIEKIHSRFYNGAAIAIDSVTYSYNSDERGGATKKEDPNNDENILFDESYTYSFNTNTSQYDNKMRRTQTFNTSNKIMSLLYSGWNANKYLDSTQYIYTYTGNLMVESDYKKYLSQNWSTVNLSTLDYDVKNNVVSVNSTAYNARFTYDAANNLISIKDSLWTVSTGWHYNERKTYTYINTDVQDYTLELWDMNINKWVSTKYWKYIYLGSDIIGATEYNWNNGNWDVFARNLYTFDNRHNKTTDVRQIWNGSGFVNQRRESWTYNSFNQPLLIVYDTWNGTSWIKTNNDEQIRFSYQVYFPVSVSNPVAKEEMHIYPLPAANNINIDINWQQPQAFSVIISDMNGRMVNNWKEDECKYYHKNISVAEMPAGTYFIKIAGKEGNYSFNRFTVIH